MAAETDTPGVVRRVQGEDGAVVVSTLGTKRHWDDVYARELGQFEETGDEGEVWFGYPVVRSVVQFAVDRSLVPLDARVIEVGCGNGTLLAAFAEEGFTQLVGTDYSEGAVDLARRLAAKSDYPDAVHFSVRDLLDPSAHDDLGLFDLVLDKGTYDAVTLAAAEEAGVDDPAKHYLASVARMLKPGGLFLITSCNYTVEELEAHYAGVFAKQDTIKYPTIKFAGREGSTVVSVLFRKL